MPDTVANVILFTSVGAFVICVVAGLAILLELWKPRNPATRKWLVGGLLVSVVGGVGVYARHLFDTDPASASTREVGSVVASRPPSTSAPKQEPAPLATLNTAVPARPVSCALAPPPEWAANELGERPNFDCAIQAPYPPCAADLRQRDPVAISVQEAQTCEKSLKDFRRSNIAPVLAAKALYESSLEAVEVPLRSPRGPADAERRR